MVWAVGTNSGALVGDTAVTFGLVAPAVALPNFVKNTIVDRIEVSASDPTAIFEVTVGRVEVFANWSGSGASPSSFMRGNIQTTSQLSELGVWSVSPELKNVIGRYFYRGPMPLRLDFSEPFECLRDVETSSDHAPVVVLRRVDTSTGVPVVINFWFGEY